jgi:AraC-like DNA-binding protein
MSTLAVMPASRTAPARPPVAATPMAFVKAMAWALRQGGQDVAGVLAEAQIRPSELNRVAARITASQMEAVSHAAMRALDDEALGWYRRPWPWGSHGLLARGSIDAPNLGVALARWCRHHGMLCDDLRLDLHVQGGIATLSLHEQPQRRDLPAFVREFCHLTTLRNLHGYASWLIDSRLPLIEAAFAFAAPRHADVYGLLFPGMLRFDAQVTALRFDAALLAEPLRRDAGALRQLLQRPLVLTIRPYRRDRLLAQRVRDLLAREAASLRSAAALAERLHTSVRTLHRQLLAEGSSLQALKDAARRDRALALIQRTRQPVKRVAAAVGFLSEKSFARAFKDWTGLTPSQWRAARGPGGDTAAPATVKIEP